MAQVDLALLGAGGINTVVAQAVRAGRLPGVRIVAVAGSSVSSAGAKQLASELGAQVVAPTDLASCGAAWVLEAAGGAAVRAHVPGLWAAGINTIVMSVGAMLDEHVYAAYQRRGGVQVVLPSGGIAGLDGVRALAAVDGLTTARITSTKKPAGLRGAPYLEQNGIELPEDRAVTVFEGSAREAVVGFPANVNVAVALSLAGIGPDLTRVVVRSDPSAEGVMQLIEASGPLASLEVKIRSQPSPQNPRTSYLAGAAAVSAVRAIG
ncbi:MAG: DUF108 domain-containing protein [Trueperaceae bacterium]|nr:DUF108 domain-containing protein [Trueperaceae bacterium]MCC6309392.1 DUF108 domain-containing protein [Trueperaceae bacterium]MCO5174534.1 DUF108 domain-containing protein [Trueperaceae bacterium]MCW5818897.1 DUF108 domain-containing protein [Trueperaceae bacterium]